MSSDIVKETKGSYTLTRELWCGGVDTLVHCEGRVIEDIYDTFDELAMLEIEIKRLRDIIELGIGADDLKQDSIEGNI